MLCNYSYQSKANIQCFLDDVEYGERKSALYALIQEFTAHNIHWALACSANLFFRGVVDDFHDFDLIVDFKDIHKIVDIMSSQEASLKGTGGNGFCESDAYYHYQFGRVDVDIISGFRVKTYGTQYEYFFCQEENDYICVGNQEIPLIPMEALYVLYSMMEGWQARRRYKRNMIQEFLLSEEMKHASVLKNSMKKPIPGWIKENIQTILSSM